MNTGLVVGAKSQLQLISAHTSATVLILSGFQERNVELMLQGGTTIENRIPACLLHAVYFMLRCELEYLTK